MSDFRNPTDLLGVTREPALGRLLRACGVEEACINGRASDLDTFLALAEIMPLCSENEQAARVNRALQAATGLSVPLCPHTATVIWQTWVDLHWYGREGIMPHIPPHCPYCKPCEPTRVNEEQLTYLPNPLTVGGESLGDWTRAWESVLHQRYAYPVFTLPDTYTFRRPDPYHAGQVIRKLAQNLPISPDEESLLLTQSLRVWGQWRLCAEDSNAPLLLRGGTPSAMQALVAYLQSSRVLAPLIWFPTDPVWVEPLGGLYDCVSTGLDLTDRPSPEQKAARTQAYRKIAPWGRATVLEKKENP